MLKFVINYHKLLVFRFKKKEIIFLSIPQSQGSPKLSVQKLTFRVVGIDAVFFERMPTDKYQSE